MKSILKPDQSVMTGIASGAVIMAIYSGALPTFANIRASAPQDGDIESQRKMAAWTSAGLLGLMFLLTRDRNAFMIGGLVLAGTDFMVKHSNGINPATKALEVFGARDEPIDEEMANTYSMADYTESMVN